MILVSEYFINVAIRATKYEEKMEKSSRVTMHTILTTRSTLFHLWLDEESVSDDSE